jgi:hypothetical protein
MIKQTMALVKGRGQGRKANPNFCTCRLKRVVLVGWWFLCGNCNPARSGLPVQGKGKKSVATEAQGSSVSPSLRPSASPAADGVA